MSITERMAADRTRRYAAARQAAGRIRRLSGQLESDLMQQAPGTAVTELARQMDAHFEDMKRHLAAISVIDGWAAFLRGNVA